MTEYMIYTRNPEFTGKIQGLPFFEGAARVAFDDARWDVHWFVNRLVAERGCLAEPMPPAFITLETEKGHAETLRIEHDLIRHIRDAGRSRGCRPRGSARAARA